MPPCAQTSFGQFSTSMALTTKPESHQFEVSLFGPGVGESVVVHLGSNNWIIVDSCKTAHHQAAALEYLDGLGVDLSNDVKAVVATHWHNDHVRGLDETFTRCSSAKFICSSALLTDEFWRSDVAACFPKTTGGLSS